MSDFICYKIVGADSIVESKIVNNCATGLYTVLLCLDYAFGSRTERSRERLPKAPHRSPVHVYAPKYIVLHYPTFIAV